MVQFDGPVLELMTDGRTRFDQRLNGLGPDLLRDDFDGTLCAASVRTTRPAASERHSLTSGTSRGSGTFGSRSPAISPASARGARGERLGRRGQGDRPRGASAMRRPRAGRQNRHGGPGASRARSRESNWVYGRAGLPCRRCGTWYGPAARATTIGPPTGAHSPELSGAVTRPGHLPRSSASVTGADTVAPGNTLASFQAALEAGVHMIEFDVLRLDDGRRCWRTTSRRGPAPAADPRGRDSILRRRGVRGRRARRRHETAGLRARGGGGAGEQVPLRPRAHPSSTSTASTASPRSRALPGWVVGARVRTGLHPHSVAPGALVLAPAMRARRRARLPTIAAGRCETVMAHWLP